MIIDPHYIVGYLINGKVTIKSLMAYGESESYRTDITITSDIRNSTTANK